MRVPSRSAARWPSPGIDIPWARAAHARRRTAGRRSGPAGDRGMTWTSATQWCGRGHRAAQCGQVDPGQRAGRGQGQHHLEPAADHPPSPARHRHVPRWPVATGGHPRHPWREGQALRQGHEPDDESGGAGRAGRRGCRRAGDRGGPVGRGRRPGVRCLARWRLAGRAGGQPGRQVQGQGSAAAVHRQGHRRPRFRLRAPVVRAQAQGPGVAGGNAAAAGAGSSRPNMPKTRSPTRASASWQANWCGSN